MPRKSEDKRLLSEWRQTNWGELDTTLALLKRVRDDESASNKDRIEAGKAIARMLGGLAAESTKERDSSPKAKEVVELTEEEWLKITSLTGNPS